MKKHLFTLILVVIIILVSMAHHKAWRKYHPDTPEWMYWLGIH